MNFTGDGLHWVGVLRKEASVAWHIEGGLCSLQSAVVVVYTADSNLLSGFNDIILAALQ